MAASAGLMSGLVTTFTIYKHATTQPWRRSVSFSSSPSWPMSLRVRAAAQKQKRENTETSKFSSPPLPKGSPDTPSTPSLDVATEDVTVNKGEGSGAAEATEERASSTDSEGTSVSTEDKQVNTQEEIGQALKTLRSERVAQGLDNPVSTQDFWGGVLEETKLVEWPEFGKVLGTTGVVVAIIFGSSILLLTVNAGLAELSDNIFSNGEFAKSWTRGF